MKGDKDKSFFGYDEDALSSSSFVIGANRVLLFIILIGVVSGSNSTYTSVACFGSSIVAGLLFGSWVAKKVLRNTEFFEWDYTERKKKIRFTSTLFIVSAFFSILFFSFIFSSIGSVYKSGFSYFSENGVVLYEIIKLTSSALFLYNSLQVVNLHRALFGEDLEPGYKIQKKPDNWISEGDEIKNEDEIKDIIRRDFGINI